MPRGRRKAEPAPVSPSKAKRLQHDVALYQQGAERMAIRLIEVRGDERHPWRVAVEVRQAKVRIDGGHMYAGLDEKQARREFVSAKQRAAEKGWLPANKHHGGGRNPHFLDEIPAPTQATIRRAS